MHLTHLLIFRHQNFSTVVRLLARRVLVRFEMEPS